MYVHTQAMAELLGNILEYQPYLREGDLRDSITKHGLRWDSPVGDLTVVLLSRVYKLRLTVVQYADVVKTNVTTIFNEDKVEWKAHTIAKGNATDTKEREREREREREKERERERRERKRKRRNRSLPMPLHH